MYTRFTFDLLIVCSLLLSGCALGRLSPLEPLERHLLFKPEPFPVGDWEPAGLCIEDAWFASEDGTRLHGWFVPHPRPKAIALFCKGNSTNISFREPMLRELHQRHDLAVMTFDYRGYGRSEGVPHETGIMKDARAARAWLARRTGVEESEILLIGRSLGGAVAIDLASKDGAKGLVIVNTFASVPDVALQTHPWAVPHLTMTNRFDSISKIRSYRGPLLQAHGDADPLVPFGSAKKLHAAAAGPKRFVTISGGDHSYPFHEEFRQALDEFIAMDMYAKSARRHERHATNLTRVRHGRASISAGQGAIGLQRVWSR